jgi:uncharacterized membrane protein (UPF0127 family)
MEAKLHRHWHIRVGPLALTLALFALLGCARGPCVTIVGAGGQPRATVAVEVASTGPQREVGLMFRKHLDDNAGMIFVFPDSAPRDFWMHNTAIPLDMIFADAEGRVTGIVANAQPYSDKLLGVQGNSEYVLEVNGGFCARNGIKSGDKMDFSGFSLHASQ